MSFKWSSVPVQVTVPHGECLNCRRTAPYTPAGTIEQDSEGVYRSSLYDSPAGWSVFKFGAAAGSLCPACAAAVKAALRREAQDATPSAAGVR